MSDRLLAAEFTEIREIKGQEWVNDHLHAGWWLFAIRTETVGYPDVPTQQTVYSVGWPRARGEVIDPGEMSFDEIEAELRTREGETQRVVE